MSSGFEIERKFLVEGELPFALEDHPSEEILQGYVSIDPDGTEVRLRLKGGRRTLGVKSGPSRRRVEEEFELDERRFDSLWPLTEGRRVEKRRYVIPTARAEKVELDVYAGALTGLVTAEVEFPSEQEAEAFEPPGWLGTDVTGDARYSNQSLARGLEPSPPDRPPRGGRADSTA